MKEVIQAFDKQEFSEVVRIVTAHPLNEVINSNHTAELYCIAAHSFCEMGHFSPANIYSTKLVKYMIDRGDTIKGKDLFDGMIRLAVNSYYKLSRRYQAFRFVVWLQDKVGDNPTVVQSLQTKVLEDLTVVVYDRVTFILPTVGVLMSFTVTLFPNSRSLTSIILMSMMFFGFVFLMLAKRMTIGILKKIILGMSRIRAGV